MTKWKDRKSQYNHAYMQAQWMTLTPAWFKRLKKQAQQRKRREQWRETTDGV